MSDAEVVLLDVNVLVALAWPNHVHHRSARRWFDGVSVVGWATTPISELGFVRVSSNRRIIAEAVAPARALAVLRALCEIGKHEFWPDDARLVEPPFDLTRLTTTRQTTDVHLAALATRRKGRLATFDRGIADSVDPAFRDSVELIATAEPT